MILTLLILFFAISLIALVLSLVFKEPYYALVGFFLLFYLSFAFMVDGVDYKTGETLSAPCNYEEYYVYGWNYSGYHWDYSGAPESLPQSDPPINLFHTVREHNQSCVQTTTYVYQTIDTSYKSFAWWFGFLMALTTAFSFAFVLYDLRQDAGFKRAKEIGDEMP